jgi:hypothetical protein
MKIDKAFFMGADNVDSLYENKREIALKNAQLRSEKNNIH